jgi:hypothetical protein
MWGGPLTREKESWAMLARVALVAAALVTAAAGAGAAGPAPIDLEVACDPNVPEAVPEQVSAQHVLADEPVAFDVSVLLDRVAKGRGDAVFAQVKEIYARIDVDLRYTLKKVRLAAPEQPLPEDLIDLARRHFGGERPTGVDAVYVLSGRDFADAAVGQASCVGGIKYPDEAFAAGRDYGENETEDGQIAAGVSTLKDASARVAAHELGHLLGAHHHYATCGEARAATEGFSSPCSLMTAHLRLSTTYFGPLDGAVARGYAEKYTSD